jgi:hypothetical protein
MDTIESSRSNENNANEKKDRRRGTARKMARITGWVMSGTALACVLALIFGLLVKWLWGATLTPLFHIPEPTYWQAVGLIILAKLLFGGIGHHHKDTDHSLRHKKWHQRFDVGGGRSFFDPKDSDRRHEEYYREFWDKEGREAFEDYLSKRE